MEKFTEHCGLVVPLDRDNVDTDAMIPKQFLKSIRRTGYGPHLFDEWRWLDHGEPGMDVSGRKPNPDFVLNQPRYQGATIMIGRRNFGCGSSREHAVWALQQYGIRCVLAPSYSDIFRNNALKNGLLVVQLPEAEMDTLFDETLATPGYRLTVSLEAQTVTRPGGQSIAFEIDPYRRQCLLDGTDDIDAVLAHAEAIRNYETMARRAQPWLYSTQPGQAD
ncbi:3-isopropylmalate dehydratase small subunit [Pigmentiphaga soli]|uniref:3-isopropylmalate dehydratase small subunit n=1 Tax=Pigmentiphaga soli TaxID=1007095 RepID=A0ABP8HLN6_9BURK